ncbi:MAG: DUF1926 domain-containing protein [Deltaproteobacteria bacterium]|nr:DUF1926 domain-containing protein [Deltaproteobacteria bacterium]
MINLVMILHCHQPVGNFDRVFQMAFEKCYQPILDLLNNHPQIKVGLHLSGPLLEWMEHHQPQSLNLIAAMAKRDQAEILSGGFFEPLLAAIPLDDARGQIHMMNDYIAYRFNQKPKGFWLAERIWDPGLPLTLNGTNMSYTIVDDTHFYYAGLMPDEIYGHYLTEKHGHTLNLMATPMIMRYLIPFRAVDDVIKHLKVQEEMGRHLALYGDDGEKFGLWPGTYEWVIQKGWLDQFFTAIANNKDWLCTTTPSKYLSSHSPLGRIYLPQASYEEMTEWALPTGQRERLEDLIASLKMDGRWDQWRPFVRGGVWDNFLVKYDESNRMHKKMLFLSEKLSHDPTARDYLWRAQCNCAYWHGVFGGLYLGHLRRAIHENLIRAQACLVEKSKGIHLYKLDVDKDGNDEILIWNEKVSLGLAPFKGGGLFEIAYIPRALNLSDTLTRRPEAYHRKLKDAPKSDAPKKNGIASIHDLSHDPHEDLEKLLNFDPYPKISLLDHFLDPNASQQDYASNHFNELGDFVQGQYTVESAETTLDASRVELSKMGYVGNVSVILKKIIKLDKKGSLTVDYRFRGNDKDDVSALYGCEFNLTLYSDQDEKRFYFLPDPGRKREVTDIGEEENIYQFDLVNGSDGLTTRFTFSRPISAWFYPIITVSQSEQGFERTYQGSSLLFVYPVNLPTNQEDRFQVQLQFIES